MSTFSLLRTDVAFSPAAVTGILIVTLGAQDALAAGGRYDNLVEEFGGARLGAIGFAMGVERLLLVRQGGVQRKQARFVYIITLGEEADKRGAKLLNNLRVNNIFSDMDYTSRSLKGKMRQANELGAKYCIIIGEDEIEKGLVSLRDMESCQQREIAEKDLIKYLIHNP